MHRCKTGGLSGRAVRTDTETMRLLLKKTVMGEIRNNGKTTKVAMKRERLQIWTSFVFEGDSDPFRKPQCWIRPNLNSRNVLAGTTLFGDDGVAAAAVDGLFGFGVGE